jgi:8-oxo-dGTP diphosphatase
MTSHTVTTGALVIVPGPAQTITFVRQERGPYAGSWLLPGGKTEFGETLETTARREALEESGCAVHGLSGIGLYEIRDKQNRAYHFLLYVFLADTPVAAPTGFTGHHISEVRQTRWNNLRPHPTDMQILNDASMAKYPQADITSELARDGITMTRYAALTR